jgi:hypothetical protein
MGYVPVAAVLATATLTCALVLVEANDAGVTVAVTPDGIPSAVTETEPEKFVREIVTSTVPLPPWTTVSAPGETATVMEPGGVVPSLPPPPQELSTSTHRESSGLSRRDGRMGENSEFRW